MECQTYFWEEKKTRKDISKCRLLKFLPNMQKVKTSFEDVQNVLQSQKIAY